MDSRTTAEFDGVALPPDALTHSLELSMRRLVMIMRGLGWFWMLLLVVATLTTDANADEAITIGAMVLATVWTGVTWWAHLRRSRLGSVAFMLADGIVCLIVASASYAANAFDLFHGGYPISWMAVLAYGGGLRWAVTGSIVLGFQQAYLLLDSGRSAVSAIGSIVFVVYAVILGWLMGVIRKSDIDRRITVAELTAEREAHARKHERLELANRLHDSALQTLQVIDTDAGDAERVRSLARRQSRELRGLVDSYSAGEVSCKQKLLAAVSDVEGLFPVTVSVVVRIDEAPSERMLALCDATKEALTNAAKHAGVSRINVYAAREDGELCVYVRDEGRGFDPLVTPMGHGIENSMRARVESFGGSVSIVSAEGEGTEVILKVPAEERMPV